MKSEAGKSLADPHAWQDLKNAEIYIRNIEQGLVQVDPARAALYHQRAEAYRAQVMALDNWVREQIAKVPVDQRKIITSHDAFGYFGRAYGIRFLAPAGLSTESEPTAAQIGKLIKQIKLEGIKALFIENMTNPRLIDMLAKETGAFVGGTLYSDSLSLDGGEADSYLKMFDHNVPLLIKSMKLN